MFVVNEATGARIHISERNTGDADLYDLVVNERRLVHGGMFRSPRELLRAPDSSSHYDTWLISCVKRRGYESAVFSVEREGAFVSWYTMWWKPRARRLIEYLRATMDAHVPGTPFAPEYHVVFGLACGYRKRTIRDFLERLAPAASAVALAAAYVQGERMFKALLD